MNTKSKPKKNFKICLDSLVLTDTEVLKHLRKGQLLCLNSLMPIDDEMKKIMERKIELIYS